MYLLCFLFFFFSSRRRHTRCALVTGVQTCALPISRAARRDDRQQSWRPVRDARRSGRWLGAAAELCRAPQGQLARLFRLDARGHPRGRICRAAERSEEHTSELQSLMRISYAVFCLKKKNHENITRQQRNTDTTHE